MVPHILRLPVELHLQVLNQLAINDNVSITAVNRYFRTIVKPPSHADYLIAETDDWAKQKRLYACSGCSNFRRFEEFADAMRKGKYTRGGALANARLCLQCGIVRGLYIPGMFVVIYGNTRTLCKVCRTFTDHVSTQLSCDRCTPNRPFAPSPKEKLQSCLRIHHFHVGHILYHRHVTGSIDIHIHVAFHKASTSMPSSRDDLHHPEAEPTEPGLERPKTLFQRVSSGFSAIMPKLRRDHSKADVSGRPETAPGVPCRPTFGSFRHRVHPPSHPHPDVPRISIPRLSDADPVCPYDSSVYFSFPSIETPRCSFCGLRTISRPAPSEPCPECKSRSPFSHLASAFGRAGAWRTSNSVEETHISEFTSSESSLEDGPRRVPDTVAATRVGNPPRRASLPPDQVPFFLNSSRLLSVPQDVTPGRPSSSAQGSISRVRGFRPQDARPVSPKLHHLHGLPRSKEHPYVHKHEVEAHLLAIRTGSPSTLLRHIDEVTNSVDPREPYSNYSQTVFYGHTFSLTSRVYRRRTPQLLDHQRGQQDRVHDDSEGSFSTLTTQSPSTVGGMRLELKGGSERPRLRGGIGRHCPAHARLGDRSTSWLLRCPSTSPTLSDADRVPEGLYWLAGGRGRPITVASWKSQRPKKRMGGLLGMLVFGHKAGVAYETNGNNDKCVRSEKGSMRSMRGELEVGSVAVRSESSDVGRESVKSQRAESISRQFSSRAVSVRRVQEQERGSGLGTPASDREPTTENSDQV
ncbi:hypothetical protein FB567DRAFT_447230 [Paraphoma chrysanthemicola]|uniref:F-box domain-containing protein n=1 Tax=Paraphoma chrysanthemicola TaxID=798071 RepID=A0A8K0R1N3_9PLEO|nr:hypothetical protein FB567DRAFT_447230 [Paraphoma chrysanthemicola]